MPANICWSSRRLQDASVHACKMYWISLQRNNFLSSKTSSRRLRDVLQKRPEANLKMSWRHPARRLKDVLEDEKLLRWKRLEDVWEIYPEDVLKTCLENIFKTSWRQAKCLLGMSISNKSIFYKSMSDDSKVNAKWIN